MVSPVVPDVGPGLHDPVLAVARQEHRDRCIVGVATKLNQQDVASSRIVAQMSKLFGIDAEARNENMDYAASHTVHATGSVGSHRTQGADRVCRPNGNPIKPIRQDSSSLHSSTMEKLWRFLYHPASELSYNLAENSIRPVALSRRNWTHLGHEKAGPRVAAILSIVESGHRLNIPGHDYLAAVLLELASLSIQILPEFTPTAWAAARLQRST